MLYTCSVTQLIPQDYTYDIFISYRRRPPVLDWVRNHFYPLLNQWLHNLSPFEPRIFIDELQIEAGSIWPIALRQALRGSRYLLAIWSPDYFRSPWCLAEWQTMCKREQILGWGTEDRPYGLVYPIVFSDGEHFPPEAKQRQYKNLQKWNSPSLAFQETVNMVDFHKAMQSVCEELVRLLLQRPPVWQADWPIVTPEPDSHIAMSLPRFT